MEEDGGTAARARALLASALAVVLALAVAGALLTSGGEDDAAEAAAAPAECLRAWNRDVSAREAGRHSRIFHRYEEAQVGYAEREGQEVSALSAAATSGPCAVVFPREGLDPEVEFAGFVIDDDRWASISDSTPESTLSALQAEALGAANAVVTEGGGLAAG